MPQRPQRAVSYVRDLTLSGPDKFREFDRLCREAPAMGIGTVLVAVPEALGDTYAEVMANLHKLREAELVLAIVPATAAGN